MRFVGICAAVVVASGLAAMASCSSSDNANNGTDGGTKPAGDTGAPLVEAGVGDDGGFDASDLPPTPPAWDQPVTRPTDGTATTSRAACTFKRGDMPAATLGASTPVDSAIPIENIVVVMMENRSFDSMLGHMNEAEGRSDVEEAPANASNPDAPGAETGGTHPYVHAPHECFADTDHEWKAQHASWDDGANDGFYFSNNGATDPGAIPDGGLDASLEAGPDGGPSLYDGERAMWWYDQTDLPFEYALANSYAFADHYFCSMLGPTYPNRDFLVSGTSFGLTYNGFPTIGTDLTENVVITDELDQRHASFGVYTNGTPGLATVLQIGVVTRYTQTIHFGISDFLAAAKAGTMAQVSFVDPKLGTADATPTNDDQHPPSDVQIGSGFLAQIVNAVTTSPQWAHTALFITWDENGGIYDHVPPPQACAPDTTAPIRKAGDTTPGDFTRLGFRVPLIVVSPYVKKGYVGHAVYDHTSITRFIEAKFKIPALTARDANADPLMDLFDFSKPALLTPPPLPTPQVDDAGLQYCTSTY